MGSGPEPLTGRGPGESGAPFPGEWDLISKSNPHLATPLPRYGFIIPRIWLWLFYSQVFRVVISEI